MLQRFFRDTPGCDLVYVPLIMLRREKRVLGMALSGDIIRREVARTAVNFSEHRLGIVCAASEAELRSELQWRGIHFLAVTALENITRLKTGTAQLEEQRALLKMKLRDLQAQRRGLDALVTAPPEDEQQRQALEKHLDETGHKLQEARAGVATLDDYLEQICKVCNHPSRFLRVRHNSVTVDRMGIVPDAMSHQQGAEVVSATVSIGEHPPLELVLAAFQRTAMAETPDGIGL
jgi:chromosome segregation ATPase